MIKAMNIIDILIIIVFGVYVWDGFRRGFLHLLWELIGLVIAFIFALRFYDGLNVFLQHNFHLSEVYARPTAFLVIWFVVQIIFYFAGRLISFYIPTSLKESKINHYSGLIPAAVKGIIFISIILVMLVIFPIDNGIKNSINNSYIGGKLIAQTAQIEGNMEQLFAGSSILSNSLTGTQVQDEGSKLGFTTLDVKTDENAEKQMLDMVNIEREKVGVKPLANNSLLRNVARAQSRDMLAKGYFAHTSPEGVTLLMRLNNANVKFVAAAENIALAPTIDLAEVGLMNSPKHRDNILNPSFTEIGIGVLDAGKYGLMVNQTFVR